MNPVTVTYLGAEFVPAFTSAERLVSWPGCMAVPAPSPGESEPDRVDAWITAHAEPFYIRA